MRKFISYCRVSTAKQGISGLGLDAQREAIANYIDQKDSVAAYVEIESGRNCDRPQLHKAMEHCRLTGATLLIAKLDRLARNVAFTAKLMESDVRFVACDRPDADPFRLHIEAAIAEEESRKISERTKAALRAAKARGKKLGGWRGKAPSPEQRQAASERGKARAQAHAQRVMSVIVGLGGFSGSMSLRQLADALNARGVAAPRGGSWQATTVARVLARCG